MKQIVKQCVLFFIGCTLVCGLLYTATVHVLGQVLFPSQSNGSTVEVDGKEYSTLIGQEFTDKKHMWGRIMNVDTSTYTGADGSPLAYGAPSNMSPASDEYEALIKERVAMIKEAHPEMQDTPIPVDLVTCSGSGLDPHISVAAATYQVPRLAKENKRSEKDIMRMIEESTDKKWMGFLGEDSVNVVRMNLLLNAK